MSTSPQASAPATTAKKKRLGRVSLVCVETRRPQLALFAMERCLRGLEFGEALLLSPHPVPAHPQVRHVRIPDIASVAAYSDFMVRTLAAYCGGDHVLVAQWDGFVTDAARWDDAFLEYDYIGAPWKGREVAVGNGGFSLRSRRLLDALRTIDTPVTHPEDYCICQRYRPELEARHGIRFAPVEVAGRFSWEEMPRPGDTLGFHAFFNFHRVLSEPELIAYFAACDDGILHSVPARRLLKNLYRAGMYDAAGALWRARMRGPMALRLDAMKLRSLAWLRRDGALPGR